MTSLLCALLASPAPAAPPSVAVIYSDHGDYRHRDEYDARLRDMGWSATKVENVDFADLVERLPEFDIILGTALFNYSHAQDFSEHRQELLAFISEGGALVLTDCSYVQHVQWLGGMGEGMAVGSEPTKEVSTPRGWWEEGHTLFTTPHRTSAPGSSWAQMVPREAWTVLSKSEEGGATTCLWEEQKGFIYLTTGWPLQEAPLRNLWTYLQFRRSGVIATLPDMSDLSLGRNTFTFRLSNLTDTERTVEVTLADEHPKGIATASETVVLPGGEEGRARLRLDVGARGKHTLTPIVMTDGRPAFAAEPVAVTIPDLLAVEVVRPRHRGSIYAAHPPASLLLRATVTPDPGMDLGRLSVRARVASTRGEALVEDLTTDATEIELPLPRRLGDAVDVVVELLGTEPRATKRVRIPVIQPRAAQVFLDDAGATRLDGEPFFPIGIYHAGVNDYATLVEMGFNTVTAWGTTADGAVESLDAAEAHDLKVVLEMSAHLRGEYRPEGLTEVVDVARDHPALLCWYTVDEPAGKQFDWCVDALHQIASTEPHHPVYLVSCNPGEFAHYAPATEVLAVDPYPIPHGSVSVVASWMKTAMAGMAPGQPVWLIPQLHNPVAYSDPTAGRGPTAEEERCMVYQGLIYGAKGVIYYPWDDGPNGLVHEPALMEAVPQINAELAQLGPMLLTSERTLIVDDPEDQPGLRATQFVIDEATYILATNTSAEALSGTLPCTGPAGRAVEVLFEGRSLTAGEGVLQDTFAPLAVHVYRIGR